MRINRGLIYKYKYRSDFLKFFIFDRNLQNLKNCQDFSICESIFRFSFKFINSFNSSPFFVFHYFHAEVRNKIFRRSAKSVVRVHGSDAHDF